MDKVKDAMATGIHAGDKVGPGYRAQGRNAGGERTEISTVHQGFKIWQLAGFDQTLEDLGIETVKSQDQDFLGCYRLPVL